MGDPRRRWSPGVHAGRGGAGASSGRPISAVAPEPGCGEPSLSYWLSKDRQSRDALDPQRFAAEQAESEELKRLRSKGGGTGGGTRDPERSAAWWVKESLSCSSTRSSPLTGPSSPSWIC